ncbi:DUF6517 family protein [Natronorarus salvus]|uniref:DUF6517 family protein n=1 Tax=Natronorarus salvus TaxID=3117733 RepID=UPI002F2632F0
MNRTRRAFLATGGLAVATVAGCLDLAIGDGVEFRAARAAVPESVLEEVGYDERERWTERHTETVEAVGQRREVTFVDRAVEYDRAVEVTGQRIQGAVFAAYATPKGEVLGRVLNPIEDADDRAVAELVRDGEGLQRGYTEIGELDRREGYETTILGAETTVGVYDAPVRIADLPVEIDATLHVSEPVDSDVDFVICVGGYPAFLDDRAAIETLLEALEHPA